MFRTSLPSRIEIHQHLTPEEATILADPAQINQALLNLFENAQAAIGDTDGVVRIESEIVDLLEDEAARHEGLKAGPHVKILVQDSGCGMVPETVAHAFEPYFTTRGKGLGRGLGLAAVHGIVTDHDGAITISSEPGEGTTLEMLFPKLDIEPEEVPVAYEELPRGTEHIMVVDDDQTLTGILKTMLQHLGYRVTTVNSSEEALIRYEENPGGIDMVITDYSMPRIRGDRLAEKIMAIRPGPVILYSAFTEKIDREKFRAMGIRAAIEKPIVMADLAKTLRSILDETFEPTR